VVVSPIFMLEVSTAATTVSIRLGFSGIGLGLSCKVCICVSGLLSC